MSVKLGGIGGAFGGNSKNLYESRNTTINVSAESELNVHTASYFSCVHLNLLYDKWCLSLLITYYQISINNTDYQPHPLLHSVCGCVWQGRASFKFYGLRRKNHNQQQTARR